MKREEIPATADAHAAKARELVDADARYQVNAVAKAQMHAVMALQYRVKELLDHLQTLDRRGGR